MIFVFIYLLTVCLLRARTEIPWVLFTWLLQVPGQFLAQSRGSNTLLNEKVWVRKVMTEST